MKLSEPYDFADDELSTGREGAIANGGTCFRIDGGDEYLHYHPGRDDAHVEYASMVDGNQRWVFRPATLEQLEKVRIAFVALRLMGVDVSDYDSPDSSNFEIEV